MPSNATFFASFIFVVVVCRINKCTYICCAVTQNRLAKSMFYSSSNIRFYFLGMFLLPLETRITNQKAFPWIINGLLYFRMKWVSSTTWKIYYTHKSIVHRPFLVAQSTQLEREKRNHLAFCLVWNFKSTKQILFR